jgi:hypothetical protein
MRSHRLCQPVLISFLAACSQRQALVIVQTQSLDASVPIDG